MKWWIYIWPNHSTNKHCIHCGRNELKSKDNLIWVGCCCCFCCLCTFEHLFFLHILNRKCAFFQHVCPIVQIADVYAAGRLVDEIFPIFRFLLACKASEHQSDMSNEMRIKCATTFIQSAFTLGHCFMFQLIESQMKAFYCTIYRIIKSN